MLLIWPSRHMISVTTWLKACNNQGGHRYFELCLLFYESKSETNDEMECDCHQSVCSVCVCVIMVRMGSVGLWDSKLTKSPSAGPAHVPGPEVAGWIYTLLFPACSDAVQLWRSEFHPSSTCNRKRRTPQQKQKAKPGAVTFPSLKSLLCKAQSTFSLRKKGRIKQGQRETTFNGWAS